MSLNACPMGLGNPSVLIWFSLIGWSIGLAATIFLDRQQNSSASSIYAKDLFSIVMMYIVAVVLFVFLIVMVFRYRMEQDLTKSRSSLRCRLLLWVSEISTMRLLMFHWRRQTCALRFNSFFFVILLCPLMIQCSFCLGNVNRIPERRHKNLQHGKQN